MLLFCDVETTGLSPEDDMLLEVGLMTVTDDLEPRDEINLVIHIDHIEKGDINVATRQQRWEPPFGIDREVVNMHNFNGLWEESYHSKYTERMVENLLCTWVFNQDAAGLPLTGNTIGFDRAFLRYHMPRLHDMFHYRSLDISSLKIAANLWAPLAEDEKPYQDKKHRVIPDMYDSLRELRVYRSAYFI